MMKPSIRFWYASLMRLAIIAITLTAFISCVPIEPVTRPTLNEVRLGSARGPTADDTKLRPGEIEGEVTEVNRPRQEVYVVTTDGHRQTLPYDFDRTIVVYHGREYTIDNLEAGDLIAYKSASTGSGYIETIRIQEPVQARSASRVAELVPPRPRTAVVEGTVERVDYSLGVFDVRPRAGRRVTVSVPYNARVADVDSFRTLRRGDPVRVEGEFVSPDNLQLLSFIWAAAR
jgi:hypothetical protein